MPDTVLGTPSVFSQLPNHLSIYTYVYTYPCLQIYLSIHIYWVGQKVCLGFLYNVTEQSE